MKIQEILRSELLPVITGIYENPHLITDLRGNIFFSNKAASDFLGISQSQKNIFDIFTGNTSELFYSILRESSEKTPKPAQLVNLELSNGKMLKAQINYSFIQDIDEKYLSCTFNREELKFPSSADLKITSESDLEFNADILALVRQNFPFTLFGKDSVRRKADELKELFWMKDTRGKFILVNKVFSDYLAVQPEKIEGVEEEKFIPVYLRELCSSINDYILNSGKGVKVSGILLGSAPHTKERIEVPLLNKENKVIAIAGMTIPAASKTRRETPENLELLPRPSAMLNSQGISIIMNEDFRVLFNIDKKNINIPFRKIFPQDISSFIEEFVKSSAPEEVKCFTGTDFLKRRFPYGYSVLLKKVLKDNQVLVFIDELKMQTDMQDTSTLKGKVYDILIQSNPEPVFIYEKENLRFIDVNQAALNLYGFTKNEFLQMDLTDLYAPEDIQTLLGALNETLKEGIFSGPFRQKKKDGTLIFVEISKFALKFTGKEAHFNIVRDVTSRLDIEKQNNLFRTTFENTGQLVFVTDPSGFVRFVNNSVLDSLGYSKSDMEKISFTALVVDQERAAVNSGIFKSSRKGPSELKVQLKHSKGGLIPAAIKAFPLLDYKNEIDSFTLIADLKKEDKVKEVTKEIVVERIVTAEHPGPGENAILISSLFHEILTPINVILGFVQEITESLHDLTPEQKEAAEIINQNRTSLLNTMNSIVEYYNVEKKSPDLNPVQVSAREIIDKLQDDFKELNRSRGVEISYGRISSSFFFETDKSKFSNLLFLLCKIAGYISRDKKIILSLYPVDKDKFVVTFKSAADPTGRYIEDLIRVFSAGMDNGETGLPKLSLRLANRLLSLFNGEIHVKEDNTEAGFIFPSVINFSEVNKLTSEIKKQKTATYEKENTTEPVKRKSLVKETFLNLSQFNCLYLEDQVDSQILFKVQMKELGDIQFAVSFEEALPMLDKKHYDIIVMDINLQGEYNGLDALRIIKKMPEYKDVPVIAVTAYLLQGDRERFIAAGFSEFVAKPIFRDKMIEAMENVFRRK